MAGAIGPGDWVECIKNPPKHGVKPTRANGAPRPGGIYCVREVFRGRYADGTTDDGVMLVGMNAYNERGREGGWPASIFKPIYRPKSELIESLLRKATEPSELEPA